MKVILLTLMFIAMTNTKVMAKYVVETSFRTESNPFEAATQDESFEFLKTSISKIFIFKDFWKRKTLILNPKVSIEGLRSLSESNNTGYELSKVKLSVEAVSLLAKYKKHKFGLSTDLSLSFGEAYEYNANEDGLVNINKDHAHAIFLGFYQYRGIKKNKIKTEVSSGAHEYFSDYSSYTQATAQQNDRLFYKVKVSDEYKISKKFRTGLSISHKKQLFKNRRALDYRGNYITDGELVSDIIQINKIEYTPIKIKLKSIKAKVFANYQVVVDEIHGGRSYSGDTLGTSLNYKLQDLNITASASISNKFYEYDFIDLTGTPVTNSIHRDIIQNISLNIKYNINNKCSSKLLLSESSTRSQNFYSDTSNSISSLSLNCSL